MVGIPAVGVLMAALRAATSDRQGTFIDLSQCEVTVAMLGEYVVDYSVTGRVPGPLGNRHPHLVPQGVYPCQGDDMWVAAIPSAPTTSGAGCATLSLNQTWCRTRGLRPCSHVDTIRPNSTRS